MVKPARKLHESEKSYDARITKFGDHPIIEGLTEALTMAKLMRENEELRAALAEEKALADRFDDLNTRAIMGVGWSKTDALELAEAYRKARGL